MSTLGKSRLTSSRSKLGTTASASTSMGASRINASTNRRAGGALPTDSNGRPQIIDASGRFLTPKALVPSKEVAGALGGSSRSTLSVTALSRARSVPTSTVMEEEALDESFHGGGGSTAGDEVDSVVSDEPEEEVAPPAGVVHNVGPTSSEARERVAVLSEAELVATGVDPTLALMSDTSSRLTDADLDCLVNLTLDESATVILFQLPSTRVQVDTAEFRAVTAANERYEGFKSAVARGGLELYPSRGVATRNAPVKHKDMMTVAAETDSVGVQASSWDIYDASHGGGAVSATVAVVTDAGTTLTGVERAVEATVALSLATPGCLIDAEGSVRMLPPAGGVVTGAGGASAGGQGGKAGGKVNLRASTATPSAPTPQSPAPAPVAAASSSATAAAASDGLDGLFMGLDVHAIHSVERLLSSHALLDSLALVERCVQANLYHVAHKRARVGPGGEALDALIAAGASGGHDAANAALKALEEGGARRHAARDGAARVYDDADDGGDGVTGGDDAPGGGDHVPVPVPATPTNASTTATASAAGNSISPSASAERGVGALNAPALTKLWSYTCAHTEGLNVSCMAWNHTNRDLLAVGYGPYDYTATPAAAAINKAARSSATGLVALWSMSNPTHPQATLRTPDETGVTSLAFSAAHPNLLAAGMADGRICVYDVRKILLGETAGVPGIVSDSLQQGAHTEAVWQLQWVSKADFGEVLVSISTDGRVTQWDCKKAMAPTLLMTLKRARGAGVGALAEAAAGSIGAAASPAGTAAPASTAPEALGAAGSEGILARTSSGLSFDFVPSDTTQYFVGTEDGTLARCSTSYTEQYLEVIPAHAGPVNRIRVSPFIPSALLTCSGDWTAKLWGMPASGSGGVPTSTVFSTDGVCDAVSDIAWSPTISTLFASVTRDGHIQLWDVANLNPLIDSVVTLDADVWRARLEAEAASRAAADALAAAEARRRRRLELGEDEEDERDVARAAAAAVAAANKAVSRTRFADEDDDRKGGDADGDDGVPGAGGGDAGARDDIAARAAAPPRKKLSCVLFADNTHVLVTGDDTGHVDVYRITGLDETLDPSGAGILGGGDGTPAPVGSEVHEAQMAALKEILAGMSSAAQ